jgi:hypothetical protein
MAQLEEALNRRLDARAARPLAAGPKAGAGAVAPSVVVERRREPQPKPEAKRRKLGHVFSTPEGLEVWVAGRPYLLRPVTR